MLQPCQKHQRAGLAAAGQVNYLMRPSSWLRIPRVSSMMAELPRAHLF